MRAASDYRDEIWIKFGSGLRDEIWNSTWLRSKTGLRVLLGSKLRFKLGSRLRGMIRGRIGRAIEEGS